MADSPNPRWTDKQRRKLLERIVRPELTPESIGQMVIIVLIGILIYVLLFGDYGVWRIRAMQKEIERQQQEIEQLKAEQDSLQQERWRLINDPEYIEKLAREKYGMQKDDEVVYKFPEAEKSPPDKKE